MTTRILPPEEWPRLAGTEAETIWPHLNPELTSIVVVESNDGQILGCHVLAWLLHAECLWIHPDHRAKAGVARRLWANVQRVATEHWAVPSVITAAVNDQVRRLLAHVGATKLDGDHYVVPMKGTPCLPS